MKTNRTNRDAPGSSVQESFEPVFAAELEEIRIRRESVGIDASGERLDLPAFELFKPSEQLDDLIARLGQGGQPDLWTESHETDGVQPGLVGLALSGGGIRSSTFNLGIMQALHKVGLFPYIDYLSTVSGGGYVGTYVSTAILEDNEEPQAPVGEPEPAPSVDDSSADPASEAPVDHFPITHKTGVDESKRFRHLRNYASFLNPGGKAELLAIPIVLLRGIVVNLMVILPALLAIACWLAAMMQKSEQTVIYPNLSQLHASLPFAWASHAAFVHFPLTMMATALLVVLFAFYPLIQFLRQLLSGKDNDARRLRSAVLTALRIYLVVIGGLVFFELQPIVLSWLDSALTVGMTATIAGSVILSALFAEKVVVRLKEVVARLGVAIYGILGIGLVWLLTLFFTRQVLVGTWSPGLMLPVAGVLFAYCMLFVDVNFTSIHKFYRDKLVKAFVAQAAADDEAAEASVFDTGKEVPRLSELDSQHAPYQLLNVALNAERAEVQFKNGRKSSFFFFGKRYCGGIRTGYLPTESLEKSARYLDVGTAMAISGAAAAPNMGRFTNPMLSFVLALLNVRLNYWLPNPKKILSWGDSSEWLYRIWKAGPFNLVQEMFGWLGVNNSYINLSDGGHIENLGVYELLRRQCRLIIVGDGECDADLSFDGLAEVVRLARIDFGFQVELEGLDDLRSGDQQYAVGRVRYDVDRMGLLIYLKSNLGGDYNLTATLDADRYRTSPNRDDDALFDENTYIARYRHQHPTFPQESTADQFFDETQFESYRALGFQVAASALIAPWVPDANEEGTS